VDLSGLIQINVIAGETSEGVIYRILNDCNGLPASCLDDRRTVDARVKRKLISATNNNDKHRSHATFTVRNYI